MSVLQFFTNLSQLLVSIQVPAGGAILIGLGLAGAAHAMSWRHVIESAVMLAICFGAANLITTLYG